MPCLWAFPVKFGKGKTMLKKVSILCFGTEKTRTQALEKGLDPKATFTALMPDLNGTDAEILEDFRSAYNFTSTKNVWEKLYKHLRDFRRQQYKNRGSGKRIDSLRLQALLSLSVEDMQKYKSLMQTSQAEADRFLGIDF